MLDLHLYFSASVNVRYVLHTQSLRFIYNKILVRVSLYHFCLYLSFVGLSFSPLHLYLPFHANPFTSIILFFISHQPLPFRSQKKESAMPMAMATTMP
jgi:hypothetical protein